MGLTRVCVAWQDTGRFQARSQELEQKLVSKEQELEQLAHRQKQVGTPLSVSPRVRPPRRPLLGLQLCLPACRLRMLCSAPEKDPLAAQRMSPRGDIAGQPQMKASPRPGVGLEKGLRLLP